MRAQLRRRVARCVTRALLAALAATLVILWLPSRAVTPPAPARAASDAGLAALGAALAARFADALAADADPFARAQRAVATTGVWPLSFSRARELLAPRPPAALQDSLEPAALAALAASKTREWSSVVPKRRLRAARARALQDRDYAFSAATEGAYYAQYAASWKAWTWRKGGVDCNRHLEIIGAGAVPIFRGIRSVAPTTLFAYPRALLALAESLNDEGALTPRAGGAAAADDAAIRALATLRHFLLHWAHDHLSAGAMAAYMGRAADASAVAHGAPPLALGAPGALGRVAFFNDVLPDGPDYVANFALMGLAEWLGPARVDVLYPPLYAYAGGPASTGANGTLYGLGFGYAGRLPREMLLSHRGTDAILADARAGVYAAIVWGSASRSRVHLSDAALAAAYADQPHRLWLCDGEDRYFDGWTHAPFGPWASLTRNATVFVRELGTVWETGQPVDRIAAPPPE